MAFARGRPAARPAVAEATAEAAVMAADIGLETPVCLKAPGARINDDALERRRYFTRERNEMAEMQVSTVHRRVSRKHDERLFCFVLAANEKRERRLYVSRLS